MTILAQASAMSPVQTAIYSALTGSTALMARVTGIHDHVPQGTKYDYVALGSITEIPQDTHGAQGREMTITPVIYSDTLGNKDAQAILTEMDAVLDRQTITVSGWGFVTCFREFADTFDREGIRQIPARYRIWLQAST